MKQEVFFKYIHSYRAYCEKLKELNENGYWIDITFYSHFEGGIIIAHKL
jgi:hypothetical protein